MYTHYNFHLTVKAWTIKTYQTKIIITIVIPRQSNQLKKLRRGLSVSLRPLIPLIKKRPSQPIEGGKVNIKQWGGVVLFIVCRRRGFPAGRRKRETQYSPLASTNIPFLSYPPVASLWKEADRIEEMTYKTSDSVDWLQHLTDSYTQRLSTHNAMPPCLLSQMRPAQYQRHHLLLILVDSLQPCSPSEYKTGC